MIKRAILSFSVLLCCISLFSCNDSDVVDKVTLEQDISNAMDTIVAKLEYKPLTTKQLLPSIEKLVRGKLQIELPATLLNDSATVKSFIEELAIGSTYAQWGNSLSLNEMRDTSAARAFRVAEVLDIQKEDALNYSDLDSLLFKTNEFLSRDSLTYLHAYYEAVSWMENLSVSLDLSRNIGNRIEYNAVIRKQLLKGEDLLNYLFDYQDYPPISDFSLQLISVLEYKNAEIDVVNLSALIDTMKTTIYNNEK